MKSCDNPYFVHVGIFNHQYDTNSLREDIIARLQNLNVSTTRVNSRNFKEASKQQRLDFLKDYESVLMELYELSESLESYKASPSFNTQEFILFNDQFHQYDEMMKREYILFQEYKK